MARLRIKTCQDFRNALDDVYRKRAEPVANRLTDDPSLNPYGLWHILLTEVQNSITESNWDRLRQFLELYDAVERVGPSNEMFEAGYVAFLEDIRLPKEPESLRKLWEHSPPAFERAMKADRGLG